jgi:hypothetical protein
VGPFDAFYSNLTGNQTLVQSQQNGGYLIDTNGDGSFDYQYNADSDELQSYPETLGFEYTMLLVGMILVILLLIFVSLYGKRKKAKPQEQTPTTGATEEWQSSTVEEP